MKLALVAALAGGLSARLDAGFAASRDAVRRGLLVVAWAALVASPNWLIPPSAPLRLLALLCSAALVAVWSLSGGAVAIRPAKAGAWASWLVSAALLAWHGPRLFAPIEFRGDEDLHLVRPLRALEALADFGNAHGGIVVAAGLLLALLAFAAGAAVRRGALLALVGFVGILPFALAVLFLRRPPEPELLIRVARYPVVGAWLHTLAAFSPLHASAAFQPALYDEALYRLVPFASALGIGLFALRALKGPVWLRAAGALVIATAPTLTYFSNVLYPDLTAAALVTAGLLGIDAALRRARRGRPEHSGAVPLLALGLLTKESFLPTGLAVGAAALLRALGRQRPHEPGLWVRLGRTVVFGLALLALPALYLGWRAIAEHVLLEGVAMREVIFDPSALANPALFAILARALVEQFGPLLPLAVLGLAVSWRRPRTRLWALVLIAQLLLLAANGVGETAWGRLPGLWGHARYLLTLLPPLVCLAIQALVWLGRRSTVLAAAGLAAGLAWNAWARPVALDGSRKPHWGDYVSEPSGERYPYDALYSWLSQAGERRPLTIVGRDYGYRDDFYLRKHALQLAIDAPLAAGSRSPLVLAGGPDRAALLRWHVALLERAANARGPVVLHVSAWLPADELPREVGALRAVRRFTLGQHSLVLYERR